MHAYMSVGQLMGRSQQDCQEDKYRMKQVDGDVWLNNVMFAGSLCTEKHKCLFLRSLNNCKIHYN